MYMSQRRREGGGKCFTGVAPYHYPHAHYPATNCPVFSGLDLKWGVAYAKMPQNGCSWGDHGDKIISRTGIASKRVLLDNPVGWSGII